MLALSFAGGGGRSSGRVASCRCRASALVAFQAVRGMVSTFHRQNQSLTSVSTDQGLVSVRVAGFEPTPLVTDSDGLQFVIGCQFLAFTWANVAFS
jgi:hypothetical protein